MSSVGLPTFLSAVLLAAPAFAGTQCHDKPAAGGMMSIEEFDGSSCPSSPEESDAQESAARQEGQAVPTTPAPAQDPQPSAAPTAGVPIDPPENAHDAPAAAAPVVVAPSYGAPPASPARTAPVPAAPAAPRWVWPGPRPPSQRANTAARGVPDDLRDAPGPVAPERYSLWAGLSRPLLLSAAAARDVSPDQAKALAADDYATHILQQASGSGETPVGSGPVPSAPGAPSAAAAVGRRHVSVLIDLAGHPGDWRPSVPALAGAAGFQLDAAAAPRFQGPGRERVVLSGTVPAGNAVALLSAPGVKRVEASSEGGAPAAQPGTRILVGLRLPPDASPQQVLASAAKRLGAEASFTLERAVAVQRVPGTQRMVVVAEGRLPVGSLDALMADPEVVKVAPAPAARPRREPGAPPEWRSLLTETVQDHSAALLAIVLVVVSLSGPFFKGPRSRSA